MLEYKIKIEDNLEEDIFTPLQEYWEFDGKQFKNKPTQVAEKYNLSLQDLNGLIKKYSVCKIIYNNCEDCNTELSKDVYSQTAFRENKNRSKTRCEDCDTIYYKDIEAKRITFQENLEKEYTARYEDAILNKKWLQLSDKEFDVLRGIIKHQNKKDIYQYVFNEDYQDGATWKIVNKLDRLGLIGVKRDETGYIRQFDFDFRLIDIVDNNIALRTTDILSFMLSENPEKTNIRQPDYRNSFTPKSDIVLKAGVKYLAGGWLGADGSINLKFQPQNSINSMQHNSIDNEPKHIKDVLDDLFDDFNNE